MDYIYELDDSFMHSGIKGQKWGTRRYQNSDGSLTPEGRLHYGIGKMRTAAKNYGAQAKYKAKKMGVRAGLAADKYSSLAKQRAGEYGAHAKTMAGIAGRAASVAARNYGMQAGYKAKKLGVQASLAADKYGRVASVAARNYGMQAGYKAKKLGVQASLAADKYGRAARNYLKQYRNRPIQSINDSTPQTKAGKDWVSDWASRYTANQSRSSYDRKQEAGLKEHWDKVRKIDEQFHKENARKRSYESTRSGYVDTPYGRMTEREARLRDLYG